MAEGDAGGGGNHRREFFIIISSLSICKPCRLQNLLQLLQQREQL